MRPRHRGWALAILLLPTLALFPASAPGASIAVQVSASVPSKNECKFRSANATLAFGTLLGTTTSDALATGSIEARCIGADPVATFMIMDDSGLYEVAPAAPRMRHSTNGTAYLPYEFSYAPASDTVPKGVYQLISITGRIRASDINMAIPGSYADTVTLTLIP